MTFKFFSNIIMKYMLNFIFKYLKYFKIKYKIIYIFLMIIRVGLILNFIIKPLYFKNNLREDENIISFIL